MIFMMKRMQLFPGRSQPEIDFFLLSLTRVLRRKPASKNFAQLLDTVGFVVFIFSAIDVTLIGS